MKISLLYEYMLAEEERLRADCVQLQNNVMWHGGDTDLYHSQMLAACRLDTAQKIFEDVRTVIRMMENVEEGK